MQLVRDGLVALVTAPSLLATFLRVTHSLTHSPITRDLTHVTRLDTTNNKVDLPLS